MQQPPENRLSHFKTMYFSMIENFRKFHESHELPIVFSIVQSNSIKSIVSYTEPWQELRNDKAKR